MYDTDRTKRSLSDYKGKNVVLAFVPGAFTGTCTTEMCNLRDQMDQFNSLNAEVLGISVDPPFSQKAWADANNLNFTILSDFNREATNCGTNELTSAPRETISLINVDEAKARPSDGMRKTVSMDSSRRRLVKAI